MPIHITFTDKSRFLLGVYAPAEGSPTEVAPNAGKRGAGALFL